MEEVELRVDEFKTKRYFIKGTFILHREDGPAVEHTNGYKVWYQYGKRHRLDGSAIEWADGYKVFWIYGKLIPNVNSIEEALIKSLIE